MSEPKVGHQARTVVKDGYEMIQRNSLAGDTLPTDVAATSIAFVDGLKIDRFKCYVPLFGTSTSLIFLIFIRMGLAMAAMAVAVFLLVSRLVKTDSSADYFRIGRVDEAFMLPLLFPRGLNVLFPPLAGRLADTFGMGCAKAAICFAGTLRVGLLPTTDCFANAFRVSFAIAAICLVVLLNVRSAVEAVVFSSGFRVFTRHNNAAFPGTAGSYPTAPVRAA